MSGRPGEHDNLPIDSKYQFVVIAVDRHQGNILWQRVVREEVPLEAGHTTGSLATASPVTDGEYVLRVFRCSGSLLPRLARESRLGTRFWSMQH